MARITIEDCIEQVSNRFHVVQMTAIRAKQLKKGATPLVQNEENKEVVVALREIAAGLVTPDFPEDRPVEDSQILPGLDEDLPEAAASVEVVEDGAPVPADVEAKE